MKYRTSFLAIIALLLIACNPLKKSSGNAISSFASDFPYKIEKQAFGKKYMVVTANPLATEVGNRILAKGGNAADASVAVQMALAVVYPQAGNIGGGGFMIWRGADGKTSSLDYREKAPAAAHEKMYQDSEGNVIKDLSYIGHWAAGVPGAVAGMWETHKKYGSMDWKNVVQPAIDLAQYGYRITEQEANNLNKERANFLKYNTVEPIFIKKTDWKAGDRLVQKDLAYTLIRIRDEGRDGFYKGATAALIVREMEQGKGLITAQDLADYDAKWRKPVEFDYKNYTVTSMPMPSSGGILMQQMLGMLEPYDLEGMGYHSTEAIHIMTEVERRAFADRAKHMGDADFCEVPAEAITKTAYLRERMASFNPEKASDTITVKPGKIKESEETTHLCIVDAQGNAISITTTLNDSYGSRVVVGGAGFILNDEMDDFSAKPGSPNYYGLVGGACNKVEAGKRMLSSMTPTIVSKGDKLYMVVGTPGGSTIPTSVFQVFLNVTEFGLPLKQAVHDKRFHHQYLPDKIQYEGDAIKLPQVASLEKMGHKVVQRGPIGRVEAILVSPDGTLEGVADNRGDDHVKGE